MRPALPVSCSQQHGPPSHIEGEDAVLTLLKARWGPGVIAVAPQGESRMVLPALALCVRGPADYPHVIPPVRGNAVAVIRCDHSAVLRLNA